MNKIIIENRAGFSDVVALYVAWQAAIQSSVGDEMLEQRIEGATIHRSKNALAQTFVVMEAEKVVA